MKKRILILTALLLALSFASCNNESCEWETPEYSKNFVQIYKVPTKMELSTSSTWSNNYIQIRFEGETIYNDRKADRAKHAALSARYNDATYNRDLFRGSNSAIAEEISAINIVCINRDIDAQHPAGTSLNDIVKLCAKSPYEYIQSGYQHATPVVWPTELLEVGVHWDRNNTDGYSPIFKYLSEIKPGDLLLLHERCFLYFTKELPAGEYFYTVTVNYMGETLKRSIQQIIK